MEEILHHQKDGSNPIDNGIKHLSTGAGYLPSTVSSPNSFEKDQSVSNHHPVSIGIFACASKNSCSAPGFLLPLPDFEALRGQWGGRGDRCRALRRTLGKVATTTAQLGHRSPGVLAAGTVAGALGKRQTRSLAWRSEHGCCMSQSNFNAGKKK